MEDTSTILVLSVLAVVHIVGGVALGSATRGFWRAINEEEASVYGHVFFLLFGLLFGCFPLAYGLQATVPLWVLFSQVSLLTLIYAITTFWGPTVLRAIRKLIHINTGLLILGLLFMAAGGFVAYSLLDTGSTLLHSFIFGGVFGLIGFGISLIALINMFRQTSS
jgi:hypothetical protein